MPKEFPRTRRVAEQMQRELAELIRDEIHDPRVGMVTISGVEVSRDLAHAQVYVTVMDDGHDADESVAVLNGAAGFLRHALTQRMVIRTVPRLHFHYDASLERGVRLNALISAAVAEDADKHPAPAERRKAPKSADADSTPAED